MWHFNKLSLSIQGNRASFARPKMKLSSAPWVLVAAMIRTESRATWWKHSNEGRTDRRPLSLKAVNQGSWLGAKRRLAQMQWPVDEVAQRFRRHLRKSALVWYARKEVGSVRRRDWRNWQIPFHKQGSGLPTDFLNFTYPQPRPNKHMSHTLDLDVHV